LVFSIKTHPVKVLFDYGIVHSFISAKLVNSLGLASAFKLSLLPIALVDGKTMKCEELFIDCPIQINRHEFLIDLCKFGLSDFDIILGMDWLIKHQEQIDCPE